VRQIAEEADIVAHCASDALRACVLPQTDCDLQTCVTVLITRWRHHDNTVSNDFGFAVHTVKLIHQSIDIG
jgi:hypothetical protein